MCITFLSRDWGPGQRDRVRTGALLLRAPTRLASAAQGGLVPTGCLARVQASVAVSEVSAGGVTPRGGQVSTCVPASQVGAAPAVRGVEGLSGKKGSISAPSCQLLSLLCVALGLTSGPWCPPWWLRLNLQPPWATG